MITHWKDNPPEPPFFAVIFISKRSNMDEGYQEMDDLLMKLAVQQPGYLGYSVASSDQGSIFISYWESEENIDHWRKNSSHIQAKGLAPKLWYDYYHSMITRVESSKIFDKLVADN